MEETRRVREDDNPYVFKTIMNALHLIFGSILILMLGVFVYHWILYYLDFHSIEMYSDDDDDTELHEGELL